MSIIGNVFRDVYIGLSIIGDVYYREFRFIIRVVLHEVSNIAVSVIGGLFYVDCFLKVFFLYKHLSIMGLPIYWIAYSVVCAIRSGTELLV